MRRAVNEIRVLVSEWWPAPCAHVDANQNRLAATKSVSSVRCVTDDSLRRKTLGPIKWRTLGPRAYDREQYQASGTAWCKGPKTLETLVQALLHQ